VHTVLLLSNIWLNHNMMLQYKLNFQEAERLVLTNDMKTVPKPYWIICQKQTNRDKTNLLRSFCKTTERTCPFRKNSNSGSSNMIPKQKCLSPQRKFSPQEQKKCECQNERSKLWWSPIFILKDLPTKNLFFRNKQPIKNTIFKFWNVYSSVLIEKDQIFNQTT
jgi:hypothetical protein